MKHILAVALLTFTAFAFVGCVDDVVVESEATSVFDESDITDAKLAMSISNFTVNAENSTRGGETPTEDKEIMSDFEKQVDNIWVFQYGSDGNLVIRPRYYTAEASETDGNWNVLLKPVESTIYVVTNVNSKSWAEEYSGFLTIDKLKASTLPEPASIYDLSDGAVEGHIPAQGYAEAEVTSGSTIIVPVEHMYAKVKLRVTLDKKIISVNEAEVSSVYFEKAPWYCRVSTLYDGDPEKSQDEKYVYANGESVAWTTRPLGTEAGGNNINDPNNEAMPEDSVKYEYVIYIPENIQGEHAKEYGSDTKLEIGETLAHASAMCVVLNYVAEDAETYGEERLSKTYKAYPGGNNEDNFNIRRNQVYRVTMNLGYPIDPDNEPSANCIVIKPGTTASFEPYYRVETGGGYKFNDYISPNGTVGDGKQIKKIKILWQTENCIGNNSEGDLVYFRSSSGNLDNQSLHDKIYVTVNEPGNAVIAAYDKDPDEDGGEEAEIIWSWHIWVPNEGEDPTNVAKAITYYTYDWDEKQIYGEDSGRARVPGYGCMPCNLGALASEPTSTSGEKAVVTYGMLYQWGRKDPFPALKGAASGKYGSSYKYTEYGAYNQNTTEHLWDNDYQRITGMTDDTDTDSLFHSVTAQDILSNNLDVAFSIKNPTVFMCGTDSAAKRNSDYVAGQNTVASYNSGKGHYPASLGGDWHVNADEKLWGATEVTDNTKCLTIGTDRSGDTAHLYDDYGEKSIFDPCPYGWRVSPPDQWLGYTKDGSNPATGTYETITNYEKVYGYGMYMYIQSWRQGLTSYFPTQGTRAPDGSGGRPIRCGNYHNATADAGVMQRVNILHIHNGGDFNIFELGILAYYVKSVAGPVRCVREIK